MSNIDPIDRNRLLRELNAEAFTTYEEEVQMLYLGTTLATINAQPSLLKSNNSHINDLEWAWTIIANSYDGNWPEKGDWRDAAEKWRDRYHEILKENHE